MIDKVNVDEPLYLVGGFVFIGKLIKNFRRESLQNEMFLQNIALKM